MPTVHTMADFTVQQGLLGGAEDSRGTPILPFRDEFGNTTRVTVVTFLGLIGSEERRAQGNEPITVTLTDQGLVHLTAVLEAACRGLVAASGQGPSPLPEA